MKRFLALLVAALLFTCPALALEPSLLLTATVEPCRTLPLKAPASGELAPFMLRRGDVCPAGSVLFTVEPVRVYADIEGVVASVYVQPGDIAEAAVQRYGAVMKIDRSNRYELVGNVQSGANNVENRDLHVGTPVYIQSTNGDHEGCGSVITVDGGTFVVEVTEGDLVYNQEAKIYRTPECDYDSLLARSRLSFIAPVSVSASGTITHVSVNPGDTVHPGDELFAYVPDALAPEKRGQRDGLDVRADTDWILQEVNVANGAAVQKGQVLASAIRMGDYELCAQVKEESLSRIAVGDVFTLLFEEADLPASEAQVSFISPLGSIEGDTTRYAVYFSLPEDVCLAVWPGMHATLEQTSSYAEKP